MKTCTKCHCRLPLRKFQSRRGSGDLQAVCTPCLSAERRLRDPLPEVPRDLLQIRLNYLTHSWQRRTRWPLLAHQENHA